MIPAEATTEAPAAAAPGHRSTFFRQSGWLMIAGIGGGILMWLVHFLAQKIPNAEYGMFGVYLSIAMCIPIMPMQMGLAHQTAQALATGRRRELSGLIRWVGLGTLVLWIVAAVAFYFLTPRLQVLWKLPNPVGLWVTFIVVLFSLWAPMLAGVLQGKQDFLWMGWCQILNGVGRLCVAALVVFLLAGGAAGMMVGALFGYLVATGISVWQTRELWTVKPLPFEWRDLLREMGPAMLGFAAFQFLFTADTMFVKSYFSGEETAFYFSAGTLSRALMWLVGPLAAVMFPRIVQSAARSEKTDLMNVVLLGTAVLSVSGAIGLSVLGPWVVRFVYGSSFVSVASSVLPWYAGAMVPLALGNVLLNNLLARSNFKVVLPVCLLAIGYGIALTQFHDSLVTVLKVLGAFNLGLLAICGWYTWRAKHPARQTRSAR